ncbi:MAG: ATPase domain-containing protein, partial [Candidatus Hydrothermarchaeales archaeon]
FAIYQNVSYVPLFIFMGVVFIAIMYILGYTRAISDRTNLRYWSYLRVGLFVHMVATFYVFSLIALAWQGLTIGTKALSILFGTLALVFYILYALDMKVVLSDLNMKFSFNTLDISRYLVSLYSLFFLVFFGISFTYSKTLGLISEIRLESYPALLFFIAIFLVAFTTYLSVTHKGFEEIMKKNIWSELSYLTSFGVFIVVYLIYNSLAKVELFPLHDMFFVAYFAVLIIETYATRTLGIRSKYERAEEPGIAELLNSSASHFLRTDYLADIWEKNLDKYVAPEDMVKIRFDASTRRFDLGELDEKTRITVATAMLFDMLRLSTKEKVAVVSNDFYRTLKRDVESILKEDVLLLPEELRTNFDEEAYYPKLFEKMINDLTERISTFVPSIEHRVLFAKLARASALFRDAKFDGSKIQIPAEARFSREEFIDHFKSYLNSLEELFPFEETLLAGPIKSEIKEELINYGFSIEDLLDLVPTGIEKLDEVSDGGLRRKTSTLILSEETRHRDELLISFLKQGIRDRDRIIFATSKVSSKVICDELRKDFPTLEGLTVIDLYQDIHTPEKIPMPIEEGSRILVPTSTVLFRQSIVKAVKRYPKEGHKRVVLDVYDDLLSYYGYRELSTILFQQLDGFRKWNCTTIFTLKPGSITDEDLEEMERRVDNVIELSGKALEASIFVKKLHGGPPSKKIVPFH